MIFTVQKHLKTLSRWKTLTSTLKKLVSTEQGRWGRINPMQKLSPNWVMPFVEGHLDQCETLIYYPSTWGYPLFFTSCCIFFPEKYLRGFIFASHRHVKIASRQIVVGNKLRKEAKNRNGNMHGQRNKLGLY